MDIVGGKDLFLETPRAINTISPLLIVSYVLHLQFLFPISPLLLLFLLP